MWNSARALTMVAVLALPAVTGAEPLSAIDWLSEQAALPPGTPVATPEPDIAGQRGEGAAAESGGDVITSREIPGPRLDATGLLPPRLAGLPGDLWTGGTAARLSRRIATVDTGGNTALAALLERLLLAELPPPALAGERRDGAFLETRIDRLLAMGALDQAEALLERAGPARPALFQRWFEISLLTGRAVRACAALRAAPALTEDLPARIFCFARDGKWESAALMLEAGHALGEIDDAAHERLRRFLDPALADGAARLPPPLAPDPLTFRIMEAIGQPMATNDLPLAFAHADLHPAAGWRARINAAERLARAGAIPAGKLFTLYLRRAPPASGGVWDRVKAVQALDLALVAGGAGEIGATLAPAWRAMRDAGLGATFARHFGPRLLRAPLPPSAEALAFRIGLLSAEFSRVARRHSPADAEEAFLAALARGRPGAADPPTPLGRAIVAGFTGPPDGALAVLLAERRRGEALLSAMSQIARAGAGDPADLATGLAVLRALGLDQASRQVALEVMILGAPS